MIEFVNITEEVAFQDKHGISDIGFGHQYARDDRPLDFQYQSSEAVTSFTANRVDYKGRVTETTDLNTSLIISGGGVHTCTGQTEYEYTLPYGVYFFLVNNKYKSEFFKVINLRDTDCLDLLGGGVLELLDGGCCLELLET